MGQSCLVMLSISIAVTISGCTYMEVKSNVAPGGALDREMATANAQLRETRREQDRLSDVKLQRERELDRTERRIKAAQDDLAKQDALLTNALSAKKLSKVAYDDMRRQLDAIRGEMANLDLQNKSDQYSNQKLDPQNEVAKEAKLQALEQRKQQLENALVAVFKR